MKQYIIILLLLMGIQSQAQRVLTLQECRELALDYNKSLQMAAVDAQKAEASQKLARTAYLPALDGTGSATWLVITSYSIHYTKLYEWNTSKRST